MNAGELFFVLKMRWMSLNDNDWSISSGLSLSPSHGVLPHAGICSTFGAGEECRGRVLSKAMVWRENTKACKS